MEKVSLHENTIPHETIGEFGGGRVLLRPASPGTGVIAGGGVRAVVEAAGIRDVLAKSLGSSNHANVVKATIEALRSLRRRDEILKMRGIRGDDEQRRGGQRSHDSVAQSAATSGFAASREAARLRRKLRPRQDQRQRPQGPEGALGRQHSSRIRRRPDAADSAFAEARIQQRGFS